MNIDVLNRVWFLKEFESFEIMCLEVDLEVGYEGYLNLICKMNFIKFVFSLKIFEEDV